MFSVLLFILVHNVPHTIREEVETPLNLVIGIVLLKVLPGQRHHEARGNRVTPPPDQAPEAPKTSMAAIGNRSGDGVNTFHTDLTVDPRIAITS